MHSRKIKYTHQVLTHDFDGVSDLERLPENRHLADVVRGVRRPDPSQLQLVRAGVQVEAGVAADEEVSGRQHLVALAPDDHVVA